MRKNKAHRLANRIVKSSGYARGYFPEMASHFNDWVSPGSKGVASTIGNNLGTLALLATLLGGGYYLYNSFNKKKEEADKEDDENYSKVPKSVTTGNPTRGDYSNWFYDDEDDESDYDDETDDFSSFRYDAPDYEIKNSHYKLFFNAAKRVNKIREWLHK